MVGAASPAMQVRQLLLAIGLSLKSVRHVDEPRSVSWEAVGISMPSGGFKTLPVWLEISFRVSAVRCC
jgi:hypothetical protein